MARLEIRLLGRFEVTLDGQAVTTFETNSARALLAYLASEPGRTRPRPLVAEMLWPDRPPGAALSNVRHVLSVLRSALGDRETAHPVLIADGNSVAITAAEDVWVDLAEFERLAQAPAESPGAAGEWTRAVDLWRGTLLEGLNVRAGVEWEEWLLVTSERARRMLGATLRKLVEHHERSGAWERAIATARRLAVIDPWDERGHRQLMRLMARTGEGARALSHFAEFEDQLLSELGTEPAPETVELVNQIRAGVLAGAESEIEIAYPAFLARGAPPRPVFVGRGPELNRLEDHLAAALAGRGGMVFVAGEAGSGKTMLAGEFMRRATEVPDLLVARGRCSGFAGLGDPYLPFRELLGLLCGDIESGYTSGALDREQATRLWEAIPRSVRLVAEVGPSLVGVMVNGELLLERLQHALIGAKWTEGLIARLEPFLGRPPAAERLQPALFDEYTAVLERLAIAYPLLLVVDDLQWADQGSIALLWHLARRIEGMRALVVGIYRPGDIVAEGESSSLGHVLREIEAVTPDCVVELASDGSFVDEFLDSEPNALDKRFRDRLLSYTGGHPLFTTELVRSMQERGEIRRDREGVWRERGPLDWGRLPTRVEAAIAQRVGRLSAALQRDLAVASVQGGEFIAEVVAQAGGDADAPVRLSREGSNPGAVIEPSAATRIEGRLAAKHRFRHVLFQRYLYERLDAAERMRLHESSALALEGLYRDHADLPVVDLARHFDAAGLPESAIGYFHRSGQRALEMSAAEEAIGLFERARALIASLPESAARDQQELALLSGLFAALMSARGYASPEAEHIGERVRELCDQLEPSPTAALAMAGLATVLSLRSRYDQALEASAEAKAISDLLQDRGLDVATHQVLGYVQTWSGDLASGHRSLRRAYEVYEPAEHAWLVYAFGSAAGPEAMAWDAINTQIRGYPDQAADLAERAVASARRLGHPFTICHVVAVGEVVRRQFAGNVDTGSFIDEVETLARSEHFPFYEGAVDIYRGWAAGYSGDPDVGVAALTRGLATWRGIGVEAFEGGFLADIAWFEHLRGSEARARETIDRALHLASTSGEHLSEMTAALVRAKILVAHDAVGAERALRALIDTARGAGMRLFDLQAATELALLYDKRGDRRGAEEVLAPAYSWFTEGFETAHLQAARSLLETI